MATIIEQEQAAESLARTILSDIIQHNQEKVQQARQQGDLFGVMIEEIEDGRVLFRQRVLPRFYPLYEQAVRRLAATDLGDPEHPDTAPPLSATGAERLARAILADTQLYNEPKLRGATTVAEVRDVLAEEIEEGRALFRQRVRSTLHEVFERQLKEWVVAVAQRQLDLEGRPSPTPLMGFTSRYPQSDRTSDTALGRTGPSEIRWLVWLGAIVAGVAIGLWWLSGC